MYSVILMAAMTANTAEAPAFGHKACGCQGGLYLHSSCYGCSGCWGSCYGCSGCWGSCYGCSGCYGACYGCSGCYGCMGCYGVYDGGWSCCGCHGGWYGYGAVYDGGMMAYPAPNPMSTTTPAPNPNPPATGTPATPGTPPATGTPKPGGTSAKLIIEKPADAKIYVDEKLVTSEGTRQTFATPALDPAQAFFYTVRVEAVRDGKPASETRRVIVRSGETVQESFRDSGIFTASAAK